mmetsp:Transcript_60769/g.157020  ORF Transcript_60769/g.157020 Transcript_60769/m.157020 type:complete len:347 (+) Transcript_60769:343-1383(+)
MELEPAHLVELFPSERARAICFHVSEKVLPLSSFDGASRDAHLQSELALHGLVGLQAVAMRCDLQPDLGPGLAVPAHLGEHRQEAVELDALGASSVSVVDLVRVAGAEPAPLVEPGLAAERGELEHGHAALLLHRVGLEDHLELSPDGARLVTDLRRERHHLAGEPVEGDHLDVCNPLQKALKLLVAEALRIARGAEANDVVATALPCEEIHPRLFVCQEFVEELAPLQQQHDLLQAHRAIPICIEVVRMQLVCFLQRDRPISVRVESDPNRILRCHEELRPRRRGFAAFLLLMDHLLVLLLVSLLLDVEPLLRVRAIDLIGRAAKLQTASRTQRRLRPPQAGLWP